MTSEPFVGYSFTGPSTTYTYSATNGRLTNFTDADGSHDVTYDERGLVSKITIANEGDYLFEYDSLGRNTKPTYGSKPAVVIGRYDPATQEAAAFSSEAGRHAEDVASDAMPNGFFSQTISVRRGAYTNVCVNCELKHGRSGFPAGTGFDSDY